MVEVVGKSIDQKIESDKENLDTLCEQNEFVLFDNSALSRHVNSKSQEKNDVELQLKWTYWLGEKVRNSSVIYIPTKVLKEYHSGIKRSSIHQDIKDGMRLFMNVVEEKKRVLSIQDVKGYDAQFRSLKPLKKVCGLSETDYQLLVMGAVLSESFATSIVTNDTGIIDAFSFVQGRFLGVSMWSRLYDFNNDLKKVDNTILKLIKRRNGGLSAELEKRKALDDAGFVYNYYRRV